MEAGGGGRSPQEGAETSCCFDVGMAKAGTPTLMYFNRTVGLYATP